MISTVGTLTDLKGDDFWTKGVSWSCKYCGCEDLKCLWYVTKGQYSFKGSFLCRNCGKRKVEWVNIIEFGQNKKKEKKKK